MNCCGASSFLLKRCGIIEDDDRPDCGCDWFVGFVGFVGFGGLLEGEGRVGGETVTGECAFGVADDGETIVAGAAGTCKYLHEGR